MGAGKIEPQGEPLDNSEDVERLVSAFREQLDKGIDTDTTKEPVLSEEELITILEALHRGMPGFDDEDAEVVVSEVQNWIMDGAMASLVLKGFVNLHLRDGEVFLSQRMLSNEEPES